MDSPVIATAPERPVPHSVLAKIAAELGAKFTADPDGADAVIWWDHRTVRPPCQALAGVGDVVNGRCVSVSKSAVNAAHPAAFGYPIGVDPRTHHGPAVEKPEVNASHSGRIVQCPTVPRYGYVYQQVIDNRYGHDQVQDIRVPVIGGTIPLLYLKYRPDGDRFSNTNTAARYVEDPATVLSETELQSVLGLAAALGADYAELDCLRDEASGRLSVVDVNPTPWGPPNGLAGHAAAAAVRQLSAAFADAFLRSAPAATPSAPETATTE